LQQASATMSGNHSEETTAKLIGEKRLPDEEKIA